MMNTSSYPSRVPMSSQGYHPPPSPMVQRVSPRLPSSTASNRSAPAQQPRPIVPMMRCNKCYKTLNSVVVVFPCDCLVCEECDNKRPNQANCPCCRRKINMQEKMEILVSVRPPTMTEDHVKKKRFQRMFVKKSPDAPALTNIDMWNRLRLQYKQHNRRTHHVLKQAFLNQKWMTSQIIGLQNRREHDAQEIATLKEEKYKRQDEENQYQAKIATLQELLDEKESIILKFRRMGTPERAGPESQQQSFTYEQKHLRRPEDNQSSYLDHHVRQQSSSFNQGHAQRDPRSRATGNGSSSLGPSSHSQRHYPYHTLPESQIDGRQRLSTPVPPLQRTSQSFHRPGGRIDEGRQNAFAPSQNPYEQSIRNYSRNPPIGTPRGPPMSQRHDHNISSHSRTADSSSVAGSQSTSSSGRIRHITKDTPFSFSGGARNVHHRGQHGNGAYDQRW